MTDDDTETPRRWPALLLLAAALVWLGVAAALGIAGAQDYQALAGASWQTAATTIGSFVLQLLPPLAVAVLAFAVVRSRRPASRIAIAEVEARHAAAALATTSVAHDLAAIDVLLDRAVARVVELRGPELTDSVAGLDAAAARLNDGAARAEAASASLAATLPDAHQRAQGVTALLDAGAGEATRQLGEIAAMLAAVRSAADDAAARHHGMVNSSQDRLTALATLADQSARRVGEQGTAIRAAADAAFEATGAALDTTRAGVEAQTAALLASVDQARVAMDHIGGEAMRVMQKRLDRLLEATDALGAALGQQDARSRTFVETVERSFAVLDAKLGNAAATGNATLDVLAARLQAVQDKIHHLGTPLGGTHDAVLEIETAVGRLEAAAGAAIASLGTDLPATHDGVTALGRDLAGVQGQLDALAAPVGATDATVARIAAQLTAAQALAGGVETATGTAALTASTQLIEVLGRVREVAAATAGTMRTTLGDVVAEARDALADAGSTTARSAFGDPVRAELGAVAEASERAGAAAQAAADRVSQRLLGLTKTVATVEARIDEVDTRYDIALRDDLAKRSEALVMSLNDAAIDIARSLSIEVGDGAWEQYLKGDRGVFARRTVRLLDRGTARQVARHFVHDAPFHEQATRFIVEFETLLKRVMPDREGKALAVTLLSSDIGKLYVVLAQATERLR